MIEKTKRIEKAKRRKLMRAVNHLHGKVRELTKKYRNSTLIMIQLKHKIQQENAALINHFQDLSTKLHLSMQSDVTSMFDRIINTFTEREQANWARINAAVDKIKAEQVKILNTTVDQINRSEDRTTYRVQQAVLTMQRISESSTNTLTPILQNVRAENVEARALNNRLISNLLKVTTRPLDPQTM